MGDEAPITLRYADGKEGMSKVCKLVCAAVFSSLAKKDIQTFDEIPVQQWEALAGDARAKVESKPFKVKTVWRNPDVAESGGGFKVKKSQIAFPKMLKRAPLAPSSRDGQRYCVDFQYDRCQEGDSCQLGLHRCAAVFRGGRTGHGNHPGIACRSTNRHAVPAGTSPKERGARDQPEMKRFQNTFQYIAGSQCSQQPKIRRR